MKRALKENAEMPLAAVNTGELTPSSQSDRQKWLIPLYCITHMFALMLEPMDKGQKFKREKEKEREEGRESGV